MESNDLSRLRGFIGLAMRAGKLSVGTEQTCLAMAKTPRPRLILVSASASPATKKKVTAKSSFYGIPICEIPIDIHDLGHLIGKTTTPAALALHEENIAGQILQLCGIVPSQRKDDTE